MVIIEFTYVKPISEVERFLKAHIAYLEKYYAKGIFIVSGRKVPREGGVILALTDKAHAKELIQEDPFLIEKIAEVRLIEFETCDYDPRLADILNTK